MKPSNHKKYSIDESTAFTRLQQRITGYREDMIVMQRELVRRVPMGPVQGEKASRRPAEMGR
jgi:hypothetical protein